MRNLLILSMALLGMSGLLTACDDLPSSETIYQFWSKLSKVEKLIWMEYADYVEVETVTPSDAYYFNGSLLLKHEIYVYVTDDSWQEGSDYSQVERPTPDPDYSELIQHSNDGKLLGWRCYQYKYKNIEPKDCSKVDRFMGIDIYQYNGKYYCCFNQDGECFALNKEQDKKGKTIYWSCLVATYKFDRYPIQVL